MRKFNLISPKHLTRFTLRCLPTCIIVSCRMSTHKAFDSFKDKNIFVLFLVMHITVVDAYAQVRPNFFFYLFKIIFTKTVKTIMLNIEKYTIQMAPLPWVDCDSCPQQRKMFVYRMLLDFMIPWSAIQFAIQNCYGCGIMLWVRKSNTYSYFKFIPHFFLQSRTTHILF